MPLNLRSLSTRSCSLAVLLTIGFTTGATAQTPPDSAATPANVEIPIPPEAPTEEQSEEPPKPSEICTDENTSRAVIDRVHSRLFKLTCSSASWFDGLFGNSRYDDEYRSTHGSVTVGSLWSERKSWQEKVRFRARMYLPQLSERFHAFVGRVDRDDYISESESDVYGLPEEFNRDANETTLVGIGYNEPLKKRGSFDADAGVHVTLPLDPYVKGSYRFARVVREHNLIRLRETAFWQNSEGLGVTSRADWDRIISEPYILRLTGSGTFSEVSEGVRWFGNLTLFHFLNDDRAIAYELAANGSTDREVPLTDYGVALIFRQRVWREWLLLELRGGVDWPRDFPFERRHSNLNAGVAFELRFGNDPALREIDRPIEKK